MKTQHLLPILLALTITVLGSCSKEYSASGIPPTVEDSFNLSVNFTSVVDSQRLHLDSTYRNFWGESYSVSAFKFYVSKFELINTDSGRVYPVNTDKYFLIDAADSSNWTVKLLAAPFVYNRISFLIGIDSLRNVSGVHTGKHAGALDSTNGMFWNSSNGYIMAKLEGHSSLSTASNKSMAYQIGGFSGDNSVLRTPTLLFPFGQYLQITPGKRSSINISADVNAWFFNPHQLKIANTSSCTAPGLMAKYISENYSKMYTVNAVVNN